VESGNDSIFAPGMRASTARQHVMKFSPDYYTMQLALDAIRGQRSAHSLETGPVMAEPVQ